MNSHRVRILGLLLLCLALACGSATAATLTVVNSDGANEGFNDPAARAPIGGNPMTTLGGQRLYAYQYAANVWGSILYSNVPILITAAFNPMTCDSVSATLGSTSTSTIRNFSGAPYTNTWFAQSLANSLAGSDLSASNDMNISYNSTLDNGTCLGGATWYYGLDGNEGNNNELLPVVLHEIAHGLGFRTSTNGQTGSYSSLSPDIYDYHLYDNTTSLHWNQETATQRRASAIAATKLAWDGPYVASYAPTFLGRRPELLVNSPAGIAGEYSMVGAAFGAAITDAGVTADVALADDGTAPTSDGCTALVNPAAIAGKWALIDRGTCTFVIKAQAAQAAGAVGVIIGNNAAGLPPNPLGGADATIVIPIVGISLADATTLKGYIAGGLNVTVKKHPTALAGVDAANRPLMYTPTTWASGSSVSHWDVTLTPNALEEPFINTDLHTNVDMTLPLLEDIGWNTMATPTLLEFFTALGRSDGILLSWKFNADGARTVTIQRAPAEAGPWAPVATQVSQDNGTILALDDQAEAGKTYYYRLSVLDGSSQFTVGMVSATRSSPFTSDVYFGAPAPNPAAHGTSVKFRISQPEFVRLSVADASGRVVRWVQAGMLGAGEYTRTWDGLTSRGEMAPAGVYFFSLRTSGGLQTRRIAVVR